MEKVKSICVMRELLLAINDMEKQLQLLCGLSFNEAMLLCCISRDKLTSSQIAMMCGLSPSNASKVIRSIEKKGLVTRTLGTTDKRQMCFNLTDTGVATLEKVRNAEITLPVFNFS